MSWFNVFNTIKNKTCRYLLERYLGQFLEGSINLQQLKVDLYDGRATIKNVSLNVAAFNKLFEEQGWAIEIISGHIGELTVTVPWNALMSNNSYIEVADALIVVRPVQRPQETGASMLESMWSSASSSMQLAEECMRQRDDGDYGDGYVGDNAEIDAKTLTGLEKFAETIDNILNRIKATFTNTTLCLELQSDDKTKAISLCVDISKLLYENETGCERVSAREKTAQQQYGDYYGRSSSGSRRGSQQLGLENDENMYLLPMFAKHSINICGLRVYTEELKVGDANGSESNATNNAAGPTTIPILAINEHLNIHIKMKQAETINGPKVVIDAEMGAMHALLTPRQIHLLSKIMEGFQEEQKEEGQHEAGKRRGSAAQEFDDAQSYAGTQGMYSARRGAGLIELGNWSDGTGQAVGGKINTRAPTQYHARDIARASSGVGGYSPAGSSIASSSSSTTLSGFTSKWQRRQTTNFDYTGEILNFSLHIWSFTTIILMEDILVESSSKTEGPLNKSSEEEMIRYAEKFFERIQQQTSSSDYDATDPAQLDSAKLTEGKNHLYLRMAPILAEGTQQRVRQMILCKSNVMAHRLDLFEVLGEAKRSALVTFVREEDEVGADVNVCIKTDSNTQKIDVTMQNCQIELDISIYDRLSAIWASSPFANFSSTPNDTPCYYAKQEASAAASAKATTMVTTNFGAQTLELKLRFPINDVRPIHDPNRKPWWQQNIRNDYLLITFEQFAFKISPAGGGFQLNAQGLNVHYVAGEEPGVPKIWLLKCKQTLDDIKIAITIPDECYWNKLKRTYADNASTFGRFSGPDSLGGFGTGYIGSGSATHKTKAATDRLPFSAKYVCRESDTLHNKQDSTESETVLLPGETAELQEFCSKTMRSAKAQVQIHIPNVELQLESKEFYEIIYNRFNADILMWEPSSPLLNKATNMDQQQSIHNITATTTTTTANRMHTDFSERQCTMSIASDDDADSEWSVNSSSRSRSRQQQASINLNSLSMTQSIYYSFQETYATADETAMEELTIQKSNFAIEITVGKAVLGLCMPIREPESQALSAERGKIQCTLRELKLFSVSGHNGNKNVCYLCLQLADLQVDHCGQLPANGGGGDYQSMLHTLYKTPQGHSKSNQPAMREREMLSLVIETKRVPEQRIKRLRVSTGLQQTTLRYNTMPANQFWLHQLMDFLDVSDYPIEGYVPYGIVTEMQLHLWNCAIDYRPNNFDYRALIELGNFSISSNIISAAAGCNLRFITEEFLLSLAPYEEAKEKKKLYLDSMRLVPMLDIGFFDISLRLNEHAKGRQPKFDLRCSVHDAHLRTCCDSGRALAQLMEHLANGDSSGSTDASGAGVDNLAEGESMTSTTTTTTQTSECGSMSDGASSTTTTTATTTTTNMDDEEQQRRQQQRLAKQQQRVNLMMAEALNDTVTASAMPSTPTASYNAAYGIEPYFFPDEQQAAASEAVNDLDELEQQQQQNEFAEIINFEHYAMSQPYSAQEPTEEVLLPQIKSDLGDVHELEQRYREQRHAAAVAAAAADLHEDGYYFITEDECKRLLQCGIKQLKICEDPLRIVDNHFFLPSNKVDLLKAPDDFPTPLTRYTLCEMTITWHLYGGRDFTPVTTSTTPDCGPVSQLRMSDAYRYGVSYSKSENTVQPCRKPRDVSWKSAGGAQRDHAVMVEIQLTKARLSHETYPKHTAQASRQVLVINDIEIRDRLQSSEINKFLYHPRMQHTHKCPQPMLVIKAMHIRPQPKLSAAVECSLRISLLPIRLHIDQDTLIFLADFFTNIGSNMKEGDNSAATEQSAAATQPPPPPPEAHAPVLSVGGDDNDSADDTISSLDDELKAREMVSLNLDLLENEVASKAAASDESSTLEAHDNASSAPLYFREVIFSPEVPILLDYHGRRIELSRGPIAGLLMGLGQLECSEIRLKKIVHRRGFLGIEKLMNYLCKEWLNDIKRNQVPKILKGVGPTYSLVQFIQGVIDLFRLPIEQYQRDGRIIRGLQLGAQSFTSRTALAALEITARVIQLLQFTAETAFDLVSSGPSITRRVRRRHRKDRKKRTQRPTDVREGMANAYMIVKEGINDSAATLIETTITEHDQKGYTGAVGAVMRQIPQLVVCPAVLATQATTNILGGVKSSLVPEAKVEARDKWKTDND